MFFLFCREFYIFISLAPWVPIMRVLLFLLLIVHSSISSSDVVVHFNDGNSTTLQAIYTTLGITSSMLHSLILYCSLLLFSHLFSGFPFFYLYYFHAFILYYVETLTPMRITILNRENIGCRVEGIPKEKIEDHLLVVTHDITKDYTFEGCNNYFFDYFANIGYFAKKAEQAGAAGVLVIRDKREKHVCTCLIFIYLFYVAVWRGILFLGYFLSSFLFLFYNSFFFFFFL